ncbi:MAG: ATP-binding cassette domain-containing protein, partial [Planctomycetota bacterium]|nr:ATP-binding cassette domain-containing protein [Planctomycetota bacterium]
MDKTILQVNAISKAFFGNEVLRNVSFAIQPGEVYALIGENGAGKSTLMKIIVGEYRQDAGTMLLAGQPLMAANPAAALGLGIAIVHQELNPIPDMSISDNLFIGREISRLGLVNEKAQLEKSRKILAGLNLSLNPRLRMRQLSIAQMQMVEIAKVVSFGAKVIILDEPTSAITEGETRDLFRTIRLLTGQGVAVIYITHKLDELYSVADRIGVLRDGELVHEDTPANTTKEKMISAMVGREISALFPSRTVAPGEVVLSLRGVSQAGRFSDVSFDLRHQEILGI